MSREDIFGSKAGRFLLVAAFVTATIASGRLYGQAESGVAESDGNVGAPDAPNHPRSHDGSSTPNLRGYSDSRKDLDSPKPVLAVKQSAEVRAWEMLAAGMKDDKAVRRTESVAALGSIGVQPRVVRLIESALSDKDESVRQTAALTLGKMKARQSIPKLRESLNDSAPQVSFAAAQSLWQLGDHSRRDVFIDVLAGERKASDGFVKGKLKETYKKYHSPSALALLGAKEAAGALFGPLGYGIAAAEELAKDRSASARVLSASLLAADPKPDCVRELKDALQDKNWTVRAAAAEALGKMPHLGQSRDLEPLLNDDKDAVRFMAAGSIVRLSQSERKKKIGQTKSQSEPTTATRN